MISGSSNLINGLSGLANSSAQLGKIAQAGDNLSAISQYKNAGSKKDTTQALQQFEGLFVGNLLKIMFDTVPVNEIFGGGFAEQTYREMMVDEYGLSIAKSGGIGIADSLQKNLVDFKNITTEASQVIKRADEVARSYSKIYNF